MTIQTNMQGAGIAEAIWLIIMIVLITYFFAGVDIIAWMTGGSGKRKSIPDKVFGVVRFVVIALLVMLSALLVILSVTNRE